jgi:uncharacterized protein
MKTNNILILIITVALIIIVFYSFTANDGNSDYVASILKEREERTRYMLTSDESPITDKKNFKGLSYYPPDPKYRIVADLSPISGKKVVVLATSDGREQRYIDYAYAEFFLDGVKNRLLILEVMDAGPSRGNLFLAFGDGTSAVETYGAGRYLDLAKVPGAATITLDFNKAYNPFCAYNETYSCPLPPPENLLKIAIRAGEKNYDH